MFSLNTMPNLQDSSARESSSFHHFFTPSMETHPCPYSFFFVYPKAAVADKMRRNHHPDEKGAKENLGSTDFLSKCDSMISNKKPKLTTTSSSSGAREAEVSTELNLFDESWNIKKRKLVARERIQYDFSNNSSSFRFIPKKPAVSNVFSAMERMASFRFYSDEEEEEERSMGVSTSLKLYEDPWIIKKSLMESDIGGLSRLLLKKEIFQTRIIPMLGPIREKEIESNEGTKVTIWDYDTESEHQLKLKKWPATKSYVLINGWRSEFVNRRDLKQGDEIELFWYQYSSRFGFRVLRRVLHH